MKWSKIKEGMVFNQSTFPRFLFFRKKSEEFRPSLTHLSATVIGIDSSVKPGDPEWEVVTTEMDWEDYFQEAELVEDGETKRLVFKNLFVGT